MWLPFIICRAMLTQVEPCPHNMGATAARFGRPNGSHVSNPPDVMSNYLRGNQEVEIRGYSERGLLNALFYEIRSRPDSLRLLGEFMSLLFFPRASISFRPTSAKILIEQSFSGFGDADCVLLIDNQDARQSVFIEAKVKTSQRESWSIEGEFGRFEELIKQTRSRRLSSNLFMQLYHKVRLVRALQSGGITLLQKGIPFPKCSRKRIRKIGHNEVVLRAVEMLRQYSDDAFFVALVPDDVTTVKAFFDDILKNYKPFGFERWEVSNWGHVSWAEVEDFCRAHGLAETLKVFKFNEGQIY